jgi:hypothetical protein
MNCVLQDQTIYLNQHKYTIQKYIEVFWYGWK